MLAPDTDRAMCAVMCVSGQMPVDDLDAILDRHPDDAVGALEEIVLYNAEHGLEPMPLPEMDGLL